MIFLGNSPNAIAYLSGDDILMTTIENALHRGGFSEEIISAANKDVVALEQNKINSSYVAGLLEEFLKSPGDSEDLIALDITIEAISQGVADDEDISESFFNNTIQPRLPIQLLAPLGLITRYFLLKNRNSMQF